VSPSRYTGRAAAAAVWAATLLPPFAILALLDRLAVNMPFQDDWDMLPVVTKWRAGTLSAGDFWQQHSEHRVAGLKAFIWTIGNLTDFDVITQMNAGFIFVAITLALVGDLLRVSAKDCRSSSTALALPAVSLLLFSLVQQENWFWATASLQLSLVNLCTVMLVWAFTRWPDYWRSLTFAAGCAVLGMFTDVSGQVLWVIGALAIGLGPQTRRRRTPRFIVWILAGVTAFGAYVWQLLWAASSVSAALRHPGRVALFAGACLGLPCASWTSPDWSAIVGWGGFVALCTASWGIYRCAPLRFRSLHPFLLLATHGLLVSILIAIGRAGGDLQTALTSHYAFAPTLFWMTLVVVLPAAVQVVWHRLGRRARPVALGAIVSATAILGIGYVRSNLHGYREAYARSRNLQMALAVSASTIAPPREVLRFLYPPDEGRPQRLMSELRTFCLGPFSPRSGRETARLVQQFTTVPVSGSSDGFHDGGDCNGTTGWAWDPAHPDAAVVLDVWSGDTRLGTVTANWFRWDLWTAGKGNGQHAFRFLFPTQMQLQTGRVVTVTFAGTQRALRGNPRLVQCRE